VFRHDVDGVLGQRLGSIRRVGGDRDLASGEREYVMNSGKRLPEDREGRRPRGVDVSDRTRVEFASDPQMHRHLAARFEVSVQSCSVNREDGDVCGFDIPIRDPTRRNRNSIPVPDTQIT